MRNPAWGVGKAAVCLCAVISNWGIARSEIELHVAVDGLDTANGSPTAPLASLQGARDRIRELRQHWQRPEPVTVYLHQGTYYLTQTFVLQGEDSGAEDAVIVYRAADGERAVISGSLRLPTPRSFQAEIDAARIPEAVRPWVRVYELSDFELHPSTTALRRRALDELTHPASIELFHSGSVLPRAGWPNEGWARLEHRSAQSWRAPREIHAEDREHVWAHGFWSRDWKDSFEKLHIEAPDQGAHQYLSLPYLPTQPRNGARYRIENALAELDSHCEWFLDESTQRLYVVDGERGLADSGELRLSHLETLISLYEVEYVQWIGLELDSARCMGMELAGCHDVYVRNCSVHSIGNVGINVFHGTECEVDGCDVHHTGSIGIRIEGGERASLTPCHHRCLNNQVHRCGYSYRARRAGISIHGVGIELANNEISWMPDWAIAIHGNEHRIQRNHIHDVCRETADTGAIYLAHDPSYRGNAILENHIHDLGGYDHRDVMAIYLDDFASGTEVVRNHIHHAPRGIVVGGGRDNRILENEIHDCLAAVQIDNRGTSWARHRLVGERATVPGYLTAVNHDRGVYAAAYPSLVPFLQDSPGAALGNQIRSNLLACQINIDLQGGLNKSLVHIEGNDLKTAERASRFVSQTHD